VDTKLKDLAMGLEEKWCWLREVKGEEKRGCLMLLKGKDTPLVDLFSRKTPVDQLECYVLNGIRISAKVRGDLKKKVAGRPMIGPAGPVFPRNALGFGPMAEEGIYRPFLRSLQVSNLTKKGKGGPNLGYMHSFGLADRRC
jgi:hypothetical protein